MAEAPEAPETISCSNVDCDWSTSDPQKISDCGDGQMNCPTCGNIINDEKDCHYE